MTREEIIQGLQFTIDMFRYDPFTGETITEPRNDMDKITIDACSEAIAALKAESCDRLKLDGMLEDAYEHGYDQARHDFVKTWIPVGERLPEKDGEYITTMKYIGKATGTIYIDVEETFFDVGKGFNVGVNESVIAWMPLPEPYKEEGD